MSDLTLPLAFTAPEHRETKFHDDFRKLLIKPSWISVFLRKFDFASLHAWDALHTNARLRRLTAQFQWCKLKADILEKLSRCSKDQIIHILNVTESIKDCLWTSQPDRLIPLCRSTEFQSIVRWAISLETMRRGGVCTQWKLFISWVKWRASQSKTVTPDMPKDIPGMNPRMSPLDPLPGYWQRLCPWLVPVMKNGIQTKFEGTRVLHLCTSRNLPAAGKSDRERSKREHYDLLTTDPEVSQSRIELLRLFATCIGHLVHSKGPLPLNEAHLSLTNSASYLTSVSDGGRAEEVRTSFYTFLHQPVADDVNEETWFGRPFFLKKDVPPWQTMCRTAALTFNEWETVEFGESAPADFDFSVGEFIYQDPVYGFDEATGFQLLQWSIYEGMQQNCITGSPFVSPDRLKVNQAPKIRCSAIGEPGNKSRVITEGESWLTILLQPFAHALVACLKQHPSATAGLTRGWQLFEWVKRLSKVEAPPTEPYFLSSDLKTATDYCIHEYSLALLEGFMTGCQISNPYLEFCAKMLCSPRLYEFDGEYTLTKRGILMGDPGAKVVLTLFNLVAEYEAFYRYHHSIFDEDDDILLRSVIEHSSVPYSAWRHFACAGDDHIAVGPLWYLQEITRSHHRNGMKVSWASNFLSKTVGYYCEEMVVYDPLHPQFFFRTDTRPLYSIPYDEHPHVDALKIRLLSPCPKECEGKDEPNPAIGKASTFNMMVSWFGGGWASYRHLFAARWESRLKAYLPTTGWARYLPTVLGGLGCPVQHLEYDNLVEILLNAPDCVLNMLVYVLAGSKNRELERVLSQFSTNARLRGVEADIIELQIRDVLKGDLITGYKKPELQALFGLDDEDFGNLKFSNILSRAKKHGLVPIGEAIKLIDRPYLFRNMLAPHISRRHGIDPTPNRAYDKKSWGLREKRLLSKIKEFNLPPSSICERILICSHIAKELTEGRRILLSEEIYLIPRRCVASKTLCTLRTPLE